MKPLVCLAVLLCLTLTALGQGNASRFKERVFGKWEAIEIPDTPPGAKVSMQFKNDGTLEMQLSLNNQIIPINGTYTFVKEDVMQVSLKVPNAPATPAKDLNVGFTAAGNLTLTEAGKAQKMVLKRVP